MFHTNVAPKALLAHLQAGYMGRHTLNLLELHNEMRRYHLEVEGIPEYINMLLDTLKKGRASRPNNRRQNNPPLCDHGNAHN